MAVATPEAIANQLAVEERVILFCVAAGRIGPARETALRQRGI
jgi:hypothetical protein